MILFPDPVTTQRVQYYRMYNNNSYPVSLSPLYIHNSTSTTKKSVAFFYFSHVIRIFRPIYYYYKRLSPVWRILLMIWIWQESLGKPPSPPPPSLLADFLISLDENYYSSSSSRGTEEQCVFAGVDGMKSVFMKCSYLSLSSGRVGTSLYLNMEAEYKMYKQNLFFWVLRFCGSCGSCGSLRKFFKNL